MRGNFFMNTVDFSCYYGYGKQGKSKEYTFYNSCFLEPLQKQISSSIPLITSVTLTSSSKKALFSIYVGKELYLSSIDDYYIEKYDLDIEELERFSDAGYQRICLLNYKKYDVVLIGLGPNDRVVSDYFALKREMVKLMKLQGSYLKLS